MRRGGSGKEVDNGAGSSLGSTSGEEFRGESSEAQCLAMLARSGLSMLAGKGTRLRPFTQPSALGLRFVKGEENGVASVCSLPGGGSSGAGKMEPRPPLSGDVVRRLSMDECWRMILEIGTRWPTWSGVQAVQATLGVKKESDDSTIAAVADGEHRLQGGQSVTQQREQEFVELLSSRALKALAARSPPWSTRAGMSAPKQTHERLDRNLAVGNALKAPRIPTLPTLLAHRQPTPSIKAPTLSRNMPAPKPTLVTPQTAELTIFYDGIVNVCDNVPIDKARLIMMYAEKAGLSAQAGALVQRSQFAPSFSGASPQAAGASLAGPSPQRALQPDSKPNKVPLSAGPSSSTSCGLARSVSHVGNPASEPANENAVCANRAAHGKAPLPVKVTDTTRPANPPRQLRQHVMLKPLPNARRNSLARFLDSRKRSRWTGASSEETSPKKPAIGEGGPSDAAAEEESQGNEKKLESNVAADGASSDPC